MDRSAITLDQIRYFLAAADFQHVGKAARSVYISPSAISSAVAAMERELGQRLFERKRQRIFLTPVGHDVKRWAAKIIGEVDSLKKEIKRDTSLRGSYRLAASHFLAAGTLGRAWIELQKRNPELTGEIRALDSPVVWSEVLAGRIDLGLCFNPVSHPELDETLIYKGSLLLAARKNHPIFRRRPDQRLRELSSYPAVLHRVTQGVEVSQRHAMFERFGIQPRAVLTFEGPDIALEKLKASNAWTFLPDIIIKSCRDLRVIARPPRWDAPCYVKTVRHKSRPLDRALRALIDELRDHFPQ